MATQEEPKVSLPKQKKENLRYLYDMVPSFEESEITTSQNPNLISIDDDSEDSLEQSLTSRRREYILSKPVESFTTPQRFQRAIRKMRGVRMFNLMLEDIRLYGTGSNLFDAHNSYKKNIQNVMKSKFVSEKKEDDFVTNDYTILLPDSVFGQI